MNKYKSHALFLLKLLLIFTAAFYSSHLLLQDRRDLQYLDEKSVFDDIKAKEKIEKQKKELHELSSLGTFQNIENNMLTLKHSSGNVTYKVTEDTNLLCIQRFTGDEENKIDMSKVFIDFSQMSDKNLNEYYGNTEFPIHQIIGTLLFSEEENFPIKVNYTNDTLEVKLIVIYLENCQGINK